MQFIKQTGADWCERRIISDLQMDRNLKLKLEWGGRGGERSVKNGRGVRQGCSLSPILFNLYSEYLIKGALEGLGDFTIRGQVLHTVRYANDLVLLPKEPGSCNLLQ